jgi:hypothetical protein
MNRSKTQNLPLPLIILNKQHVINPILVTSFPNVKREVRFRTEIWLARVSQFGKFQLQFEVDAILMRWLPFQSTAEASEVESSQRERSG